MEPEGSVTCSQKLASPRLYQAFFYSEELLAPRAAPTVEDPYYNLSK